MQAAEETRERMVERQQARRLALESANRRNIGAGRRLYEAGAVEVLEERHWVHHLGNSLRSGEYLVDGYSVSIDKERNEGVKAVCSCGEDGCTPTREYYLYPLRCCHIHAVRQRERMFDGLELE